MTTFKTSGVCAKEINFLIDENIIKKVEFIGGCDGNLTGISSLLEGMDVDTAIKKLSGISCGPRPTSCPDQLAKALKQVLGK